jgi:hypothetical protein
MRIHKLTNLKNGNKLFAYFANNRGRGTDNCTLVIVPNGIERPSYSRDIPVNFILAKTRTSAWKGDVFLSNRVCNALCISKTDII